MRVPPPMDDRDIDLQSRIRNKLSMGEPLTETEKAFFVRMYADKGIPPEEVQRDRDHPRH